MVDPSQALEACREAGFTEGQWCEDVRAGRVRLDTLSAEEVVFVSDERPLQMGDATNLWESYQNGSIQPVDHEP